MIQSCVRKCCFISDSCSCIKRICRWCAMLEDASADGALKNAFKTDDTSVSSSASALLPAV